MELLNKFKSIIIGYIISLGMNPTAVEMLAYLIALDMAFGTVKAMALGKALSGRIFLAGLFVKLLFIFLPMSIAFMGNGIGYKMTPFVTLCMCVLIVNESISIWSNFISIRTKREIETFDLITVFSLLFRDFLVTKGGELLDKFKKAKK